MKKENLFWGLFFIVGAIALIVNKLGLLGGISLWTIFFTVFLAAMLIKSVMHRSASGILFSIAFLCILYDKELGITALTPWTVLGAAALGSIGCSMLFQPWRKNHWEHHGNEEFEMETIEGDSIHLRDVYKRQEQGNRNHPKHQRAEDERAAGQPGGPD